MCIDNGAGKTTMISMLTGLIETTGGDASVYGKSIKNEMQEVQSIIGVCPQQNVLFDQLTVQEHLLLFARMKFIPMEEAKRTAQQILQDLGLWEKAFSLSKNLSGGMKRKLSLAMAFVGNPKVVYLDEPTS
jgi:ATP-binding cassette subfamily A (ABC1) protein 3